MSNSNYSKKPSESSGYDHDVPPEVAEEMVDDFFSQTPDGCKKVTDIEERPDRQIYQIRMMWALTEEGTESLGDHFDLPGNAILLIIHGDVRADVPGPTTWGEGSLLRVKALFALVQAMLEDSRS